MYTCRRQYPGGDPGCMLRSLPQGLAAFPMLKLGRLRITVFEACSTFTRVTACILAESPSDPLHRRLQPPIHVRLLRLLPAGATVAGWASPTGRPCLCTAHFNSLLGDRSQIIMIADAASSADARFDGPAPGVKCREQPYAAKPISTETPNVSHGTLIATALTVKLRGRTEASSRSRRCTLSSRTRGDTTAHHGPLQRLLGDGIRRRPFIHMNNFL